MTKLIKKPDLSDMYVVSHDPATSSNSYSAQIILKKNTDGTLEVESTPDSMYEKWLILMKRVFNKNR